MQFSTSDNNHDRHDHRCANDHHGPEHGGTMLAVSPTLMVGIVVGQMAGMVWFGIHSSIIKYH